MARIFISHSSLDNEQASAVRDWLRKNGWDDVFLDVDPERGIAAGERWIDALQKAAHSCEVVLALVSENWLASSWCKTETSTARLLGKKVLVALIGAEQSMVPPDMGDEQCVDLIGDPDGYARLKNGLIRLGLDPTNFAFPAGRRPYPGFRALDVDDAAVFFGRDAQIVRGLDKLRSLARARVEKMLVILGASGAGKSSFMRAGLWPRLRRDHRTWLPIRPIRPEHAVISGKFGLAQALEQLMNEAPFRGHEAIQALPRSRARLRDYLLAHDDSLARIFFALQSAASDSNLAQGGPLPPTIVLPIDQGEELYNEEGAEEARRFVVMLTRALESDVRSLAIVAIRTDSFPRFQEDETMAQIPKDTFTLDRLLEGSFRSVIERPAGLVSPVPLKIDPLLTDALLDEISGPDALPLLAFTLQRLFEDYGADGELTLSDYNDLGGTKGVIDSAIAEAFAQAQARGRLPKAKKKLAGLVRDAFIPHLARVSASGEFVRRVAARSEIPQTALALVDCLCEHRLLVKDRRGVDGEEVEVVEIAHEALLREWDVLRNALQDRKEFLVAKVQLEHDVRDYSQAARADKNDLLLTGVRLTRWRAWQTGRPQDLSQEENAFVEASWAEARKKAKLRARFRVALTASALALSAVMGLLLWIGGTAWQKSLIAQSRFLSDRAIAAVKRGDPVTGQLLALEGLRDETSSDFVTRYRPYVPEARASLGFARSVRREKFILAVNKWRIWDLAFSPDDKVIATAAHDYSVRLWSVETGQLLKTLSGHKHVVRSVEFSADGSRLLTASWDKCAYIWDVKTGQQIGAPFCHDNMLWKARFSPDNKRIVTASDDTTAVVWDVASGRRLLTLKGHRQPVWAAAYSPDGSKIATASKDRTGRLWNATTGELIFELKGHKDRVLEIAFNGDGTRVVTASTDTTLRIWDTSTGQSVSILKGHKDWVYGVAFSGDGERVVSASKDRTAIIWDAGTGQPIETLAGHTEVLISVTLNAAGILIATGSGDGSTRIWDTGNRRAETVLSGHSGGVRKARFSPDGKYAVSGSEDRIAYVWDLEERKKRFAMTGHDSPIWHVAYSPDGKVIATGSTDGAVRLWNASTGRLHRALSGHTKAIRGLQFSPGSDLLASASEDHTARLWNVETGRSLRALVGHRDEVWSVSFRHDGRQIVTASRDKTSRIWDVASGAPLKELEGHTKSVWTAIFSPDDSVIATGSRDQTIRLWRAHDGAPLHDLKGHTDEVWSLSFSPDGKRLASGSKDRTARIWRTKDGTGVAVLKGHTNVVETVMFSPDNRMLVTASMDKTARVWDARTGNVIKILSGHENRVRGAEFSRDSSKVITGSNDKTVRIWATDFIPTRELIDDVRRQVPRCLTKSQRQQYHLDLAVPKWCLKKWPYALDPPAGKPAN